MGGAKRKTVLTLCSAVFFAALLLPVLQYSSGFFEPVKLRGFVMPKPPGKPPIGALLDGSWQKKFELWFLRRHGFWGHLVRLDNQLNFDVFKQVSASYKASLQRGRGPWLFQTQYLNSYNAREFHAEELLQTRAHQLKLLQDLLAERGIGMLLLISANKLDVHPEIVPQRYKAPYYGMRKNSYQRMLPMLDQAGVRYFDTAQYFIKLTETSDIRYYTPSGSHWNDVGACLVAEEIVDRIEAWEGVPLTHFSCAPIKIKPKPRPTDMDLAYIANLWDSSIFHRKTPYPATKTQPPETMVRPKVLFVGTSFVWSILRFMDFHKVYRYSDFLYYYNRVRNYPTGRQAPLNREEIDWDARIFSNDFVIFEVNTASIQEAGFEFLLDAIHQLSIRMEKQPPPPVSPENPAPTQK